jgi:Lysylphosphatidylglycerol synthase TM region
MQRTMYFLQKRSFWLKLSILGIVFYFLYSQLTQKQEGLLGVYSYFKLSIQHHHWFTWLVVVLLLPINWLLEGAKWQVLANRIEHTSLSTATKAVLVGLVLGSITPLNVGDFAGKMTFMREETRQQSVGAILLGNGIQFYWALVWGTISIVFFLSTIHPSPHWLALFFAGLCVGASLAGLWLFIYPVAIKTFFKRFVFLRHYQHFFEVLGNYTPVDIFKVFVFSFGRYLTYTLQLMFMFRLVGIMLPYPILGMAANMVFFAKTVVPSFNFLSDLGIREVSSVYVFNFFGIAPAQVVAATLSIWLINVLIPMLAGLWVYLSRNDNKIKVL